MPNRRGICSLLAPLLVLVATSLQGLDRSSANSVWVAETEGAIWLSSSDGSVRAEITGFTNVRAASVDVRRETVWLLGDGLLVAYDLSGTPRFSLPIDAPQSVHADMVVVPSTGVVWVGAHEDLLIVGPDGQRLGSFKLSAPTVSLGLSEAEAVLWVGTERAVEARDLITGAPVGAIPLPPAERLKDLSVDPASGRVWVAAGDRVRLHEPSGEISLERSFPGLARIAAAPEGAAWVGGNKEIAHLDGAGHLGPSFVPLDGQGTLQHLIVSGEGSVWVANQTTIARLTDEGAVLDRLSFQPPIRIWDLTTNTDWIAPTLQIQAPPADVCLADARPSIELAYSDLGWGVDPATLRLLADAQPIAATCATAPEGATCRPEAPLSEGQGLIGATVSDYAGNESTAAERRVIVDTIPPQILVGDPPEGAVLEDPEVTLSGTVSEPAELTIAGSPVALAENLTFSHGPIPLEEGSNQIELVAVDCAGNTGRLTATLVHEPPSSGELPPNPATVAPVLDPTVPTELHEATRFLFDGPTPIQFGVDPAVIDPARVAVVRGRVVTLDGEPLAGVRVEVFGHAELGHTLSRVDGAYDLVVNGGAELTLEYSRAGYLPVHRPVRTPWRDFVVAEDVVLLPHDEISTAVDLGSSEVQVARGSVSVDEDGTRQATVVVPAGTEADLVLADGSRQPISSLTVRATEYTVGPRGPEAMPAPLPPTSGYTYAVELSADEAIAAGATSVAFSAPVYLYVENFLGFAVGSIVPAGYYDREAGMWVPSENGRVVAVLDVVAGRAVLDVGGAGQPADSSQLEALGVTDGELSRLAELYSPGTSLWRTPIPHFTPWDCNWPYGPPEDAEEPPEPDAEEPDPDDPETDEEQDDDEPAEDEEDPACEQGSVIECENQVLGEDLPLVGSPQSLHYRSNRVPGRRVADVMKVRLSGRSVPASLQRIELRIDIAGRRIRHTFAPAPNQTFTFTWDRKDAYGRALRGRHPATAHVGYVYPGVYYEPAQFAAAFAAVSSRTQVTPRRAASEITLWRSSQKRLGSSDATMDGLGGWTLSDHHLYDPSTREVYLGDGRKRAGGELASFESLLGTAAIPPIRGPVGFAAAPEGGLYLVDIFPQGFSAPFYRVWKIRPDGHRETPAVFFTQSNQTPHVTVAPGGDLYFTTCDGFSPFLFSVIRNLTTGRVWTSFGSECPQELVVAPDGSFYHLDLIRFRLLHRRTDGSTSTLLQGTGPLSLTSPVLDPQGRIYVSAPHSHQVLRIDPDGSTQVVAGTGQLGFGGDGGLATEARLSSPGSLAVAPDGSLLIADALNRRVRRIAPSGVIHTLVGSGSSLRTPGPIPPLAAGLSSIGDIAVTADGSLYVGEVGFGFQPLQRLAHRLPGFTAFGEVTIVSESRAEVYVFDPQGRHLRTLDALTGAAERVFGYDAGGRLVSITDAFDNVTRVERDASGAPAAIVAPFGQRTDLELDGEGYLASVTNPAGESHRFEYGAGGLLRSLTDPEGHEETFEYSPLGRLVAVRDAAGGSKTLRRWVSGPGRHRLELTTAEGRETSYSLRREVGGTNVRSMSSTSGTTVQITHRRDGSRVVALPSGTSVRTVERADPQFGLQSPVVAGKEVTTPSGLSLTASVEQEATLATPGDPFSVSSLRTILNVNGREGVGQFDAATREVTTTSPVGRTGSMALDEQFRPLVLRPPGTEEVRYQYDLHGRLTRAVQGEGDAERVVTLSYDQKGLLASVIDPLDRGVRYEYDDAGRLVRQTQPDGRAVHFGYDANGNLTSIVPPGQSPHLFRYTPVDALGEYEPPQIGTDPGLTTYTYDRDRRLVEVTQPGGRSKRVTYDPEGRISTIAHPAAVVELSYNPASGQLTSMTDGETTLSYSYDGSLLTATTWSGLVQGTVGRAYDDNFWLRSLSVNGDPVTIDYDDDGLLTRAGELSVMREAASGRIAGTAVGAVATSASYNAFGELESLEWTAGANELYAIALQRDRLGRIATKTETVGGVVQTYEYSYDSAGRLKQVDRSGSPVEHYRYDENGNRLAAVYPWGELAATYDEQDRLLIYGETTFTYSAAGELTRRTEAGTTTVYDYDAFANLRRVELPSGDVIEYVIDGRNRRIGRRVNGVFIQGFLYQDTLNPVAELDGAGAIVARFVYGGRANVPAYMVKGGRTYRLVSDQLGSVRLVVDVETGTIAQRLDYDAFGRMILDTAPGFQPFGFAGGLSDPLTGLVRFGARDYDPRVGRWTTKDPIGFRARDLNLYRYAYADPVNFVDPDGRKVVNECDCTIYVKPGDRPTAEPLGPGETYGGDQDGVATPDRPDEVFKNVDGVNLVVGNDGEIDVDTNFDFSAGGAARAIGQLITGGWKDRDWLDDLHNQKRPDHGWDPLFDTVPPVAPEVPEGPQC
jgi:RHS repeat-associated protein